MLRKYLLGMIFLMLCGLLFSARSASMALQFNIPDIQQITLGDAQLTLNLNYSGNSNSIYEPRIVNTTYSIVSTGSNKQLMCQINQDMPTHTTLEVRADAPNGAISLGYLPLSATPQTIITNISNVNQQNLLMYFRLKAELGAPVSVNENRVITFTIMD